MAITTSKIAIDRLRSDFPSGSNVGTVVRHVSRSGMSRSISVLAVSEDREIHDVSHDVAVALGWKFDRNNGGVKVDGAGMDMAFRLVYSLAQVLHGNGYALNKRSV
jgi:hypothetical protein